MKSVTLLEFPVTSQGRLPCPWSSEGRFAGLQSEQQPDPTEPGAGTVGSVGKSQRLDPSSGGGGVAEQVLGPEAWPVARPARLKAVLQARG